MQNENVLLSPSPKQSKKVKTILKSVATDAVIQPVQDTMRAGKVYKTIGLMSLRREANIPNSNTQTLVLEDEVYEELMVRGIRAKLTWDELTRNIIMHHLKTYPDSKFLLDNI